MYYNSLEGDFFIFLIITNRFDPLVFLGVVLYVKTDFFSLFFLLNFNPPTRGLKKRTPQYMTKIENHPRVLFYSLVEAF